MRLIFSTRTARGSGRRFAGHPPPLDRHRYSAGGGALRRLRCAVEGKVALVR